MLNHKLTTENEESDFLPAFGGNVSKVLWQREIETLDNPFRYCGEYLDEETGNYYLRARYYDPTIGRFISEDPYEGTITNPLSLNLYTYYSNNPVNFTDPSGLKQTLAQKYKNQKVRITWDNKNKTARVYNVRGEKIGEHKVDNKKIRIENGRVVIYSKDPSKKTNEKHSVADSVVLATKDTVRDPKVQDVFIDFLGSSAIDKGVDGLKKATVKKVAKEGMKSAVPVIGQTYRGYQIISTSTQLPSTIEGYLYTAFTFYGNFNAYNEGWTWWDERETLPSDRLIF